MLEAGLGISTLPDPQAAGREAAARALDRAGPGGPDLAVVMATAAHGSGLPELVSAIGRQLGEARPIVAASVEGLVAPGVEVCALPAVSVLALSSPDAVPFLIQDLELAEERAGEEIASLAGGRLRGEDLIVFFAGTPSLRAGPLLAGLGEQLAPATLLGTVAAPISRGPAFLWHAGETARDALAGMILRPAKAPRLAITQACRPVSRLLTVTRARGNWVLGLDGKPALGVYEASCRRQQLPEAHASGSGNGAGLLVGLSRGQPVGLGDAPELAQIADLRVRNVVGLDHRRGGFCVAEPVPVGTRLALVVRDPEAAQIGLEEQLAEMSSPAPGFGFYFNCRTRGHALFGEAGIEASQLANAFADCPISGAIGSCQFAPLISGGPTEMLTYAGALALIVP
jgi:small ligand-binding sensory domain FIST